jgi:hypothetical protein
MDQKELPMSDVKAHKNVKVMAAPTYLVNYTDGKGKTETKLALLVGSEIRFLKEGTLSKPVQQWLANDILIALGMREADSKPQPQVAHTPIDADLDTQA